MLVATTNYDGMLSDQLDLPVIQWADHVEVLEFLNEKRKGVLHLHGYWDRPKGVILGTKSYDRQVTDERRNFLQGLASLTRPTLFVGCSADGLTDPDFSLTPLRESARLDVPLHSPDRDRLLDRFLKLAEAGKRVGTHAALVAADPATIAEKREEARAHWTRVGRLDLVDHFLDLSVARDATGAAAA
jgi:hypothetical protein